MQGVQPNQQEDAGRITPEELAQYWRKDSVAAAKRMATKMGVRALKGSFPWLSIWMAEGLTIPPKTVWRELKQPLLTTDEVADLFGCDARTIRRYAISPPADFPLPVFATGKPWLWRASQIYAYISGREVPHYRRSLTPSRVHANADANGKSKRSEFPAPRPFFDPFSRS